MKKSTKNLIKSGSAVSSLALTLPVSAADWTAVTGAFDLSGEITAIMAIVGVLGTVAAVIYGGRTVLSMMRGR